MACELFWRLQYVTSSSGRAEHPAGRRGPVRPAGRAAGYSIHYRPQRRPRFHGAPRRAKLRLRDYTAARVRPGGID